MIWIIVTTDRSVFTQHYTGYMKPKPTAPVTRDASDGQTAPRPASRVRLHADVRIQQILDSALLEFSERGFEGARMDAIAQRCQLSKGGLYAHFKGKDELFEALLTRSIAPPDVKVMDLPRPIQVGALAKWLVDQMYDALANPSTVTTVRLLIAEGARVPNLVKLWGKQVNEPLMAMLGEALREATADQGRRRSVIAREPWLAAAPVLHALLGQLILGEYLDLDMKHLRKVHVQMLCELLEPAQAGEPQAASTGKARASPPARSRKAP